MLLQGGWRHWWTDDFHGAFVRLASDLSDAATTVRALQRNQTRAREIVERATARVAAGAFSDAALDRAWRRTLKSLANSGAVTDAEVTPPAFLRPFADLVGDGACPDKGRPERRRNPACEAWLNDT